MTNKQEELEDKSWGKQKEEEVLEDLNLAQEQFLDRNFKSRKGKTPNTEVSKSFFEIELESNQRVSNLKIELLHLILSNIHPNELKWMGENLNKTPESQQEKLMILIGNIVEKIKR